MFFLLLDTDEVDAWYVWNDGWFIFCIVNIFMVKLLKKKTLTHDGPVFRVCPCVFPA